MRLVSYFQKWNVGREKAQNKITNAPACPFFHNEVLTQRRRDAEAQKEFLIANGREFLQLCF
jgi:hypothetical protein